MAKVGKLTKLKSAMKRLPSFTKRSRSNRSIAASATTADNSDYHHHQNNDNNSKEVQVHAVYVGKSRRRYFLRPDIISHPLFQELVERSGGFDDEGEVEVACEVVLFEHLLWMLESSETQLGSMEELVEYYAC